MNFYTQLTYAKPSFLFSYKNPILLIGSCFVENIGTRMTDLKFQTDVPSVLSITRLPSVMLSDA